MVEANVLKGLQYSYAMNAKKVNIDKVVEGYFNYPVYKKMKYKSNFSMMHKTFARCGDLATDTKIEHLE